MKKIIFLIGSLFLLNTPLSLAEESSLQQLIEQTPVNGILELQDKVYDGNIVIRKSITIRGKENGAVIRGNGNGNVIEIKATNVTLENFEIQHSGQDRNAGEEYAAVKVMADHNTLDDLVITDSFHGIYLSQAHHNSISNVKVKGLKTGDIGNQGNGIHVYYSDHNIIKNNEIDGTRDGMYFDYSNDNEMNNNKISHTRYGLHYMYSHNNRFNDNRFSFNTGGAAVMLSNNNIFKNNEFSLNQGTQSFGLLLQMANDNMIENNKFYQNQRGLYIDQSQKNRIHGNEIFQNQIGIEMWASSSEQSITENQFLNNVAAVVTPGGKTKNSWYENGIGNDWGNEIPLIDLDQNGIADHPVQYRSSLYQLIEKNELVYLFLNSPSIKLYEKMNQVFQQQETMLEDKYPLVSKTNHSLSGKIPLFIFIGAIIGFLFYRRSKTL